MRSRVPVLFVGLLLGGTALAQQARLPWRFTPSSGSAPLMQAGTVPVYEGAFKVPSSGGCGDPCTPGFSQGAIGIDPDGNGGLGSIYVPSLDSNALASTRVTEVTVQNDLTGGAISPTHTQVSQLPTARTLQAFTDPYAGHRNDVSPGATVYLGGLRVVTYAGQKRLLATAFNSFGVASTGKSHSILSKTFSSPAVVVGPVEVNGTGVSPAACGGGENCPDGWVAMGHEVVPAAYQAALGCDMLSGMSGSSIVGRTSFGPTASCWTLADLGTGGVVPARRLFGYPSSHPTLGNWVNIGPSGGLSLFTNQNDWNRIGWPTGYGTVVAVYRLGNPLGNCYCDFVAGDADGDPVMDPIGLNVTRITGADASTNAAGTVITLPNKNLTGIDFSPNKATGFLALPEQASPTHTFADRHYVSTTKIIAIANSGTPTASVTVSPALTGNLTAQDYIIGMLAAYAPDAHGNGIPDNQPKNDHAPVAWPYQLTWYLYDAADLIAVKNGTKLFYQVVPYATVPFTLPINYPGGKYARYYLGGMTHDPVHHKLYLAQLQVDGAGSVVIAVFGYAVPAPPPSALLGLGSLTLLGLGLRRRR